MLRSCKACHRFGAFRIETLDGRLRDRIYDNIGHRVLCSIQAMVSMLSCPTRRAPQVINAPPRLSAIVLDSQKTRTVTDMPTSAAKGAINETMLVYTR